MKPAEWRTPAILFILTLATTTLTGAAYVGAPYSEWWRGLPFSLPLILILLTHEMGHYLAARRNGVAVSPPYFIPIPPPFGMGTLGAVIRIREPITSRNALMEIGAAGPLAGMAVAIPVLIIGIALSPVVTIPVAGSPPVLSEGNSLLYLLLKYAIHGEYLPLAGRDIMMHPMAFAGWIGLLVTMINLIPVGQLDGGHVAFAWWGDKYREFSRRIHIALPIFGLAVALFVAQEEYTLSQTRLQIARIFGTAGPLPDVSFYDSFMAGISAAIPWFMWPFILLLLDRLSGGIVHPPVGSDPLTGRGRVLAIITALVFLLIFMPVPMRVS